MRITTFIVLSSFLLATSCSKEETPDIQTDDNGVIISQPYLWKKSLHNNLGFHSNSQFDVQIYYNGNIAIPTTNGDNIRQMSLISPDNGDILWSWDDRYQPETEDINVYYAHQYNNLLTYQNGDRSYCINMDNGTTQWKFRRDKPYDGRILPFDDTRYSMCGFFTNEDGNQESMAYLVDTTTGTLTEYLRANISSEYISPRGVGGVECIARVPENDSLLLVHFYEPLPEWKIKPFMGLYNINTGEWVWDRKQLIDPPTVNSGLFNAPLFYNNKVIASIGKNLVCRDLATGEEVWRRAFPQDFLFSGFIIVEDKIIANNEDTYTYCLNPDTGNIIWKTETAGTSGRISYLNGIVYFVGGSTGRLHAIDINTGKHVWKLDANLFEDNSQGSRSFKTNAIYVFEAEGNKPARIIALSHCYAYCFEAYQ